MSVFAGRIGQAGDRDGALLECRLCNPIQLTRVAHSDSLYVLDGCRPPRIRHIDGASGCVTTVFRGSKSYDLCGVVSDSIGSALYVTTLNSQILRIDLTPQCQQPLRAEVIWQLSDSHSDNASADREALGYPDGACFERCPRDAEPPDSVLFVFGLSKARQPALYRFDLRTKHMTRIRAIASAGDVIGSAVIPICQVTAEQWLVVPDTPDRNTISRVTLRGEGAAEREQTVIAAPFAGKPGKWLERGLAIDGPALDATFPMAGIAALSTTHERDQQSCVYMVDPRLNELRRITLPADWAVLPDL